MPACGLRPDAIEKAIASGSATRPTVMPAIMSRPSIDREYCRSASSDAGVQDEGIVTRALAFRAPIVRGGNYVGNMKIVACARAAHPCCALVVTQSAEEACMVTGGSMREILLHGGTVETFDRSVEIARQLAESFGARLHVVFTIEDPLSAGWTAEKSAERL